MSDVLIKKALDVGHSIAKKLGTVDNMADLEKLSNEIDSYADFVDDAFGVPDEFFGEKSCELSLYVYIALNWKREDLHPENVNNPSTKRLAKRFLDDFVEYLDSSDWAK